MQTPKLPPNLSIETIMDAVEADDNIGFCLACGAENYEVEPDACNYCCAACDANEVYGAEELLLMFG